MDSFNKKMPVSVGATRPSLLNTSSGAAVEPGSPTRMLASLERENQVPDSVFGRAGPVRRRYGLAALMVSLVGGVGAFYLIDLLGAGGDTPAHQVTQNAGPPIALLPAVNPTPALAPVAAASDVARIEFAAASPGSGVLPGLISSASALPAQVAQLSPGHTNAFDTLAPHDAHAAPALTPPDPSKKRRVHKLDTVHTRLPGAPVAVATSRTKRAETKVSAARKSRKTDADADTELVAAIIARLDRRGAEPFANLAAATRMGGAATATLEAQLRQCAGHSDLVEARQCRDRACEGHWGELDACPAARAPHKSSNNGVGGGERG